MANTCYVFLKATGTPKNLIDFRYELNLIANFCEKVHLAYKNKDKKLETPNNTVNPFLYADPDLQEFECEELNDYNASFCCKWEPDLKWYGELSRSFPKIKIRLKYQIMENEYQGFIEFKNGQITKFGDLVRPLIKFEKE